jgi:hypothetical protein
LKQGLELKEFSIATTYYSSTSLFLIIILFPIYYSIL